MFIVVIYFLLETGADPVDTRARPFYPRVVTHIYQLYRDLLISEVQIAPIFTKIFKLFHGVPDLMAGPSRFQIRYPIFVTACRERGCLAPGKYHDRHLEFIR